MKAKRLKINRKVVDHLEQALDHAMLTHCAVDAKAKAAMKLFLDTWVVAPLRIALNEIKGEGTR